MPEKPPEEAGTHTDRELAVLLMRRQAALGIGVAALFMVLMLGLPLLSHFRPDLSQLPLLGFPFSWLLLGLLFYPLTWALSAYFVVASERLEAEQAAQVRAERGAP